MECLRIMLAPSATTKRRYRIPLGKQPKAKAKAKKPIGFKSISRAESPARSSSIHAPNEKHLLTIAPTGAGKFRSMLAAELLTYPGPTVYIDVKGEAYAVTARRRREIGQRVIRLDPFEVIGPSCDALNFFDLFSLPNGYAVARNS